MEVGLISPYYDPIDYFDSLSVVSRELVDNGHEVVVAASLDNLLRRRQLFELNVVVGSEITVLDYKRILDGVRILPLLRYVDCDKSIVELQKDVDISAGDRVYSVDSFDLFDGLSRIMDFCQTQNL